MTRNKNSPFSWVIFLAFVLSLLYWIYVGFITQIIIAHDAAVYEQHGLVFRHEGWASYLRGGPRREPLYPLLISFSISLAQQSSLCYQTIIKLLQLFILFMTQFLVLNILRKLHVRNSLCALAVLYIGFSPALVNSALSLYSEILTYPTVLLIILWSQILWKELIKEENNKTQIAISSVTLGVLFLLATGVKGIFQLILPLYLFPFALLCTHYFKKKSPIQFKKCLLLIITLTMTFYIPFNIYKASNKALNGNYTYTSRGAWALYGNTARRTSEKLSARQYLAALSYVPGPRICNQFFDDDECLYWSDSRSNALGALKRTELNKQGMSEQQKDQQYTQLVLQNILHHPIQFTVLSTFEWMKMFFWESSKIGYVAYPDWMDQIFWNSQFENTLSFSMALLTFLSFIYLIATVWKNRKQFMTNDKIPLLLFSLLIILSFNEFHSLFYVHVRYIFPIAPLYIIIIVYMLDNFLPFKSPDHSHRQ